MRLNDARFPGSVRSNRGVAGAKALMLNFGRLISSSARTSSVGNTSSAPLGGLEIDHRFEFDRAASSGKSARLASLRRRPTYMLV